MEIAAGVGGPFALAGAALGYLGWVSSQAQARAVGIDVRVLGWQEREGALSAVAWLIGPLLLLATGGLALAVADRWLVARRHLREILWVSALARVLAVVSLGFAVLGLADPASLPLGATPTLFATAMGLWLYSGRLADAWRPRQRPSWFVLFAVKVVMALLLIWAATDYAIGAGYDRGVDSVRWSPSVVLYAQKDLRLELDHVIARRLPESTGSAAYSMSYVGLRMLSYTPGERIVLVSQHWQPPFGQVVVLPDDGSFRVEYGSGDVN